MLTITKRNHLYNVETTILWDSLNHTLKASRVLRSTILTITTQAPKTMGEFAIRFNNMVDLSNEDFELLSDIEDYEIVED